MTEVNTFSFREDGVPCVGHIGYPWALMVHENPDPPNPKRPEWLWPWQGFTLAFENGRRIHISWLRKDSTGDKGYPELYPLGERAFCIEDPCEWEQGVMRGFRYHIGERVLPGDDSPVGYTVDEVLVRIATVRDAHSPPSLNIIA